MAEKASSYLRSTLVGAGLGILFGLGAAQKAVWTQSPSVQDSPLARMLSIGLVGGAAAGFLWPALGGLRTRGALGHYAAWIIASIVAGVAVMVPSAITNRSWLDLLFGILLGALGGLGLAAYTRYLCRF